MNVSLSLVLAAFRNSGDLRLHCYWGMAGMGLSLYRFSRVPGERWMCFRDCWGLAGAPMPVISRVVFLGFLSLASFGWWYAGSALSVMIVGFA